MRLGLGTVVESEDALDDVRIFGRHVDVADAAAVVPVGMAVLFQLNAECFLEVGDRSRNHHGSAREFGAGFTDVQAVLLSKFLDLFDVGRIGTVRVFKVGARHVFEAGLGQRGL